MSEYKPKHDDNDEHDDDYQEEYGPGHKYSGGNYDPRQVSTRDRQYYAQSYDQTFGDAQGDNIPQNPDYDVDEERYYDDPRRKEAEGRTTPDDPLKAAAQGRANDAQAFRAEWTEPEEATRYEYNAYGGDTVDHEETRIENPMNMEPVTTTRDDARILEDVMELFVRDDRLDAEKVDVSVEDGEVVLEGMVDNETDKEYVTRAIYHIDGVRRIRNVLQTRSG